jgi:Fe-S-cluster containining protein
MNGYKCCKGSTADGHWVDCPRARQADALERIAEALEDIADE